MVHGNMMMSAKSKRCHLLMLSLSSTFMMPMVRAQTVNETAVPSTNTTQDDDGTNSVIFDASDSVIVTNQAMGARCAVSADFDGDGHDEMAIIDTRIFDKRYRGWGITLVNFDGSRKPTIKSVYDDDPQQNFHWHGWIDACDVDGDGDIDLSAQMIGNNDLRKYPNVGKIEWINKGDKWSQKIINRDELLSQ